MSGCRFAQLNQGLLLAQLIFFVVRKIRDEGKGSITLDPEYFSMKLQNCAKLAISEIVDPSFLR